jgi:hypothetical protein
MTVLIYIDTSKQVGDVDQKFGGKSFARRTHTNSSIRGSRRGTCSRRQAGRSPTGNGALAPGKFGVETVEFQLSTLSSSGSARAMEGRLAESRSPGLMP